MYKMAFSKSVIKPQDINSCDLCESETKLKWKCLDCDLLMCNKCCDKVHPKFKNAKDHTIVDIKQVGVSGGPRNPDFTNIKCKEHTTQSCCIFCSKCDQLACPSCITKGHSGHTFIDIKEAYEMKVKCVKKSKGKLEMKKKKLDDKEKTLDQISGQQNSNCQKTIQDIQHQREALKREVDEYALKLIEEVNQNMVSTQDSISKENKKVTKSRQKGENCWKTAEKMLTTMDMSFFFTNADIIAKSIDDDVDGVNFIHISVPKFKSGSISLSNVGTLFEGNSSRNTVIDMKVNKEFTTGLKYCHIISACSDGSMWLGLNSQSGVLQKVRPEGNILTTVLTINTVLRGIAVTHNNHLLISDATSKLKLVNGQTGKVSDSRYSVDPLLIMSVHVTSDHNIIVGAMSPGKVFPVTGRRVVIVMDKKGIHLTVYEQDKHKQNIFSYPWNITNTSNGDIFVVDMISEDYRGRVLVLGKGVVLNEYSGCQDINKVDRPFKPANIRATPSNNIIVSDAFHHQFHVLDNTGNLLFYSNIIGIQFPHSLIFTSPTTFYLGCSPPLKSTTNAKLYEIQCSGF